MKTYPRTPAPGCHPHPAQTGFTLIEVLVGLVIGMLATLIIMQVFSVFENQKRTTTGVSDTLTNGNISLYKLTRDIQQAGWGLEALSGGTGTNQSPLKCDNPPHIDLAIPKNLHTNTIPVTGLAPITITDGGAGLSDVITIRYGSTSQGGDPTPISKMNGNDASVDSSLGCEATPEPAGVVVNNIALVMNNTSCTITTAVVKSPSVPNLPPLATTPAIITLGDAANAIVGSTISCLGSWHEVTYSVVNNNLVRQDMGAAAAKSDTEPVVTDVVNIQAQYGISAPNLSPKSADFNVITQWVDATAATGFANPSIDNRNRIKAIHIAIVTRDPKWNREFVTDPCDQVAHTGLCAWPDIAGSPAPTINLVALPDWRNYRYRVFEVVIPLRNVIWSAAYL